MAFHSAWLRPTSKLVLRLFINRANGVLPTRFGNKSPLQTSGMNPRFLPLACRRQCSSSGKATDTNKIVPMRLSIPDDGLHSVVTVKEWYKQEGDFISESEAICEIETPDFSYDFQSDVSGFLAKIIIPQGDVQAGDSIAYLAEHEEDMQQVARYARDHERRKETHGETAAYSPSEPSESAKSHEETYDDEVSLWLKSIGLEMVQYASKLRSEGFDTLQTIETLSQQDLKDLGIKKGHARIMKQEINKLKAKKDPPKE